MQFPEAKGKIKRTIYSCKSLQQLTKGVTYCNLLLKSLHKLQQIDLTPVLSRCRRIKRNQLLRELNRKISEQPRNVNF